MPSKSEQLEAVQFHKIPTPRTLVQACAIDSITVAEWYARMPNSAVQDIASEIILFLDLLSDKTPIGIDKVRRIAETLLNMPEIAHVTLPELRVFLRDAFNFKYGQLYGSFGWNDLAVWFRAFLEERRGAKKQVKAQEPTEEIFTPPTAEERLKTLYEITKNLNEVPSVYPYLEVFELVHAKDPDHFRKWYLDNAHIIRARAIGLAVKETILARTIGQEQEAKKSKSETIIEALIKTEYVKEHCKQLIKPNTDESQN